MGRRVLALLGLVVALVGAGPATAGDPTDDKATVDTRIATLQSAIAQSKAKEGVLTSELSAVTAELGSAQGSVDAAQATVSSLEAELARAQSRLERLDERLDVQTRRLVRLRTEYVKAVRILDARVRAAYMDDTPDMLSFLVSASSFDEVIDNVDFLTRIGRQDRQLADQVADAKAKTAAERRATEETKRLQAETVSAVASRAAEARVARDRLAAERDRLAAVQSLKQNALTSTRESRADFVREADALSAESAALAAKIQDAQQRAGSTGSGQPSSAGFIWPCDGVVTSGFGMRWGRMHDGIDIGCAYGTPVRAAAAGTVIYAGWMSGYGNLVVIDHGNGLSTAYAHASSLAVTVGQSVAQGQTVSYVGSTGHSTGPHLHFEVRVNGVAVDPLSYL
jgi:murein DD-endopeptidase MepM/ murein hydrolase activator NlpD